MVGPTKRQLEVLRLIRQAERAGQAPPSYQEVATALGVSSKRGIHQHYWLLERKGLVKLEPGKSRAARVTALGRVALANVAHVAFLPLLRCKWCGVCRLGPGKCVNCARSVPQDTTTLAELGDA